MLSRNTINIVLENFAIIWKSWILKKKRAMNIVVIMYYNNHCDGLQEYRYMSLGMDLKRSQM